MVAAALAIGQRTSWQEASEFPLQSYSTRPVLPRHLLNTYCMLSSGGRKGSCGLGLETTGQDPVLLAPFPHNEIMTGPHCHSTGWGCEQKHRHKPYRLSVLSSKRLAAIRRVPEALATEARFLTTLARLGDPPKAGKLVRDA